MLLLSLHLYSSCFSAVSRFCRIWSNLERDDWLDLENRFPQQFCHQQGKGGVCHQKIVLFLLFFYFHLFEHVISFFACILGGPAIKLIDIYCGYFLVSSLSLTEEKSAINFSWRRLKLANSITTNKTIFLPWNVFDGACNLILAGFSQKTSKLCHSMI